MPIVSVILPTYNRADLLPRAIQSVISQTLTDWELIVVDDGSTDHTRDIVAAYSDSRIRYIWQENQERSVARNTGLRASHAACISFLDSDDEYLPHKLELQMAVLESRPDIGMVLSGWVDVDNKGDVLGTHSPWLVYGEGQIALGTWLLSGPEHFCAALVRRVWLERVGGFDPQLNRAEDVDLWFRMIKAGCQTVWAPCQGFRFYRRPSSLCDPAGYRHAYLQVLAKAFADPCLPHRTGISKAQAEAIVLCQTAWRAYFCGELARGMDNLAGATQLDPSLLDEEDARMVTSLVSWAWHPLNDEPVSFARRVLDNLPQSLLGLHRHRHWALARAYMAAASIANRRRRRAVVFKSVLGAMWFDPRLALNDGLLSVLAEAVFGGSATRQIKKALRGTKRGRLALHLRPELDAAHSEEAG